MGLYIRDGSPYWWLYLPGLPRQSTKIRIGRTPAERANGRAEAQALFDGLCRRPDHVDASLAAKTQQHLATLATLRREIAAQETELREAKLSFQKTTRRLRKRYRRTIRAIAIATRQTAE